MSVILDQNGQRLDHLMMSPTFIWETPSAMSVMVINHYLNKYPVPVVVDSTGRQRHGTLQYNGPDSLTISFIAPFMATVYLN